MTNDGASRTPDQGSAAGDEQLGMIEDTSFTAMMRRAAMVQFLPQWPLIAKMYEERQLREAREDALRRIEMAGDVK
jgi:hypothetical protein